jgi:hypothetical protein
MRGRWAAFAVGSAVARNRTQSAMQQQNAQQQAAMQQQAAQQQAAQQQQAAMQQQQQEIERLKQQQQQPASSQVDVTEKIQKLGDLHQKGLLTDEEFAKMKMQLLSQM